MSLIETDIFGTTEDLVANSIAIIKEHEPEDGYYVCFSGGKDSIVMLDLIRKAGVNYDVHMNLTSVDPPELLKFIRRYYPECQMRRPKMSMFQLILKKQILPTRRIAFCCDILKEQGGNGRTIVVGVRKEESFARRNRVEFEKYKKSFVLRPILEWASDEIWEYIHTNNLPYPSLYDEGFYRIGCIGCPKSGRERYKGFQRWPQYKKAYYNTIVKMCALRKSAGKDENKNYSSPDFMWKWWMEELPKEDQNQSSLFE